MNAIEERLREALHRQVDHRTDAPITLRDVHSRAVRIRRTRRLAVAGAVAAAVAVIAPVGVLVVGDGGRPAPAPPPATDPAVPLGGRLDIRTLPQGDPPAVPYVHGDRLIDTDGSEVTLASPYHDLVRTESGWVGLDFRGEDPVLVRLDEDGEVVGEPEPSAERVGVNRDRSLFAALVSGTLELESTTGEVRQAWPTDARSGVEPVAVLPGDWVVYNTRFGAEQLAMVARPGGDTSSDETGPVPGLLAATGASPAGMVAGIVSLDDFGSCSAVVDLLTGDRVFRTCDHTLGTFSPDGQHLHARPPYLDGHGDSSIAILTADGEKVWEVPFSREAPFSITDAVWEDDDHLLAVVYQDRAWRLVRFGVDGTASAASALVRGNDLQNPFRLPAG